MVIIPMAQVWASVAIISTSEFVIYFFQDISKKDRPP